MEENKQQAKPSSDSPLSEIKNRLTVTLYNHYKEFMDKVFSTIPGHPYAKSEALRSFNTGHLWYKEAIENMPIENMPINLASREPESEPLPDTAA